MQQSLLLDLDFLGGSDLTEAFEQVGAYILILYRKFVQPIRYSDWLHLLLSEVDYLSRLLWPCLAT